MKTIKSILLAITFLCYSAIDAQKMHLTKAQWTTAHQESINKASYIFEGVVVKQSTQEKTILTCSEIKITKIYKGSPEIKIGTIKVLTEQSKSLQDGGDGSSNGSRYIIFGNRAKLNSFPSVKADNAFTLECVDKIDFLGNVYIDLLTHKYVKSGEQDSLKRLHHNLKLYERPAVQWGETEYKSEDSLQSFFKENGLTVQKEVEKK